MATPNMDERLDIVVQRLTEIQVECHRTLVLVKTNLRLSNLEQGWKTILNKISILEWVDQCITNLDEW
ncbi:hypothetical protein TorRG33x02_145900 [Trema orientale]|uniref:Uncharacterized protein n=1 Tax=Trema orientale TaxID=63057 RepID=A0A2P5EVP3_TREOI|nr:hypothetical protein TorRG33x02_145900 [Trema orientale]